MITIAKLRRTISGLLVVSMTALGAPSPASAGMISSNDVVVAPGHERISSFLDRTEVRAQLEAYGVSPADIRARVAALSDEEAMRLARQIDTLPTGADAGIGPIVGAIVLVFLVLLITDLLGLTKIFPFTQPIR
jgi:hypothetical protein